METTPEKRSQNFKTEKKWSFDNINDARAKVVQLVEAENVQNDNPRIRIKKRDHGMSFDVLLKRHIKHKKEEPVQEAEENTKTDDEKQRRAKQRKRRRK
jgi:hypothetical protein